MEFRTIVDIEDPGFRIGACEEMLFVGSCFADKIGARFTDEKFRTMVNPYGVMYNPASILHTIQRIDKPVSTAFLTLGTNHVYILKETNEIVDNCEKRPQSLFIEKELSVDECADYLQQSIDLLRQLNPDIRIVITVSPIRYRKYGYHGSQLSKATLLLAVDRVIKMFRSAFLPCKRPQVERPLGSAKNVNYFPAYEIINDELRDYRFYAEDMLHPSAQAVEYIWQRFSEVYLSDAAKAFIKEWQPIKAALNHKPFNPESQEYRIFMDKTMLKVAELQKKYPNFAV
jgi:hypothetical protein